MYHEQGMTQQQIAKRLGITRMRVSRMLQQARQEGVVTTTIKYDGFFPDLEASLSEKYPGIDFVVAEALDGEDASIKESLGATAAGYFSRYHPQGTTIAVGWGTTLRKMADHLKEPLPDLVFAPLLGGQVGAGLDVHANSVAEVMARNTESSALRIFAPAVAEDKTTRDQLVRGSTVASTLSAASGASVALFSVGSPFSELNTIERIGYYSVTDIEELRRQRAICDLISLAYYDAEGREVCTNLTDRTVSITAKQLHSIPQKICVAGGTGKHEAISVALNLGYINALVTDEITARYLTE
jgi:Transcriptional regulator, contains sigma factor-related N-terminal domain